MDSIEIIKDKLKRKATLMQIGGFRPDNNLLTSWFGRVNFCLPGEDWPICNGIPMHALCQINLTQLPYVPESLNDLEFLVVFISPDEYPNNDTNGVNWCLRAYKRIEELVPLKQIVTGSTIREFQMRGILIDEDYPCWEDFSDATLQDNPLELTDELEEYYWDNLENVSGFKIGGWPTLIQSEIYWAPYNQHPAKPEYIFQIDSTEKGNWMWGDNGVGYFGRGTKEGHEDEWTIEWQCY
ncbi:DUF1963 domain-containing protein [Clostridium sp. YIM B02505]|uniref:DUF1963 domain-containing protein n=1 Tax=Clostridium yunnanense TaxID=2800325 RepID=A0ABS1EN47_9CLOT|nr:DUF1963 domain-containing protein [Clostridium yunnanense]MBK1810764.1 DUF1963 domain-containing protein [Clostridium yunnanense]